jgi:hypothetical protein
MAHTKDFVLLVGGGRKYLNTKDYQKAVAERV